jgi:hypothetical protein
MGFSGSVFCIYGAIPWWWRGVERQPIGPARGSYGRCRRPLETCCANRNQIFILWLIFSQIVDNQNWPKAKNDFNRSYCSMKPVCFLKFLTTNFIPLLRRACHGDRNSYFIHLNWTLNMKVMKFGTFLIFLLTLVGPYFYPFSFISKP